MIMNVLLFLALHCPAWSTTVAGVDEAVDVGGRHQEDVADEESVEVVADGQKSVWGVWNTVQWEGR